VNLDLNRLRVLMRWSRKPAPPFNQLAEGDI
jgi:hypothetical protein